MQSSPQITDPTCLEVRGMDPKGKREQPGASEPAKADEKTSWTGGRRYGCLEISDAAHVPGHTSSQMQRTASSITWGACPGPSTASRSLTLPHASCHTCSLALIFHLHFELQARTLPPQSSLFLQPHVPHCFEPYVFICRTSPL